MVEAAHALTLLQLDLDLEFPIRVADTIGDPALVADVKIEFDAGLDWFIERLTGEELVTPDDIIHLGLSIWDCMPADLVEGDPAAADAVENYLERMLTVVHGIVIDDAPTEL